MGKLHITGLVLALAASSQATAAEKIRVVNEGGIREAWTLAPGVKLPVPAYPVEYATSQAETCVSIGYLLNPDGVTSDFALLKSWSANEPKQDRDAFWAAFAKAASAALTHWRFQPRAEVSSPRAVYTVATFVFASANPQETRKHCGIPNLAMRIVELRQSSKARRRMSGNSLFDQLDIDPSLEARYRDELYKRDAMRQQDTEPQPPPTPQPTPPSGG